MERRTPILVVACVVVLTLAAAGTIAANADRLLSIPVLRPLSLWLCQPSQDLYYISNGPSGPGEFRSVSKEGASLTTTDEYRPKIPELWRVDQNGTARPAHIDEGHTKHEVAKSVGGKYLAYLQDRTDDTLEIRIACGDGARPFVFLVEPEQHRYLWLRWLNSNTLYYEDWDSTPSDHNRFVVHNIVTGEIQEMSPIHWPSTYQWNPRVPTQVAYLQESPGYFWFWDRGTGQRMPILFVNDDGWVTQGHDFKPSLWSPDGRYLAFSIDFGDSADRDRRDGEILVFDRDTGSVEQLTHFNSPDVRSVISSIQWSPDGRWIGFDMHKVHLDPWGIDPRFLYLVSPTSREVVDLGVEMYGMLFEYVWSPDSREIAFASLGDDNDLYVMPIATRKVRKLTDDPSHIKASLAW